MPTLTRKNETHKPIKSEFKKTGLRQLDTLRDIHGKLKKATMLWSAKRKIDHQEVERLRFLAFQINHTNYYNNIPVYRKVCQQNGVGDSIQDIDVIVNKLMLTDDIFKSYPQELIDNKDFQGMNNWLETIYTDRISTDMRGTTMIDEWVNGLEKDGVHLVFSSGTSGNMSFVPRNESSWASYLNLAHSSIPNVLAERKVIPAWKRFALSLAVGRIAPETLAAMTEKSGLRDYDGFFLNFSGGNQGIQLAGQRAARLTRRATFLYELPMSPTAVRAIVRGAKSKAEEQLIDDFLGATVYKKEENYDRIVSELQKTANRGQKTILFGSPYLLLELCRKVNQRVGQIKLKKGSCIFFGGGWKSFDGSRIDTEEFLNMLSTTFGIQTDKVLEGYAMTEIHGMMIKCEDNCYPVPPYLQTVIYDERLIPKTGDDLSGTLGTLDPFAVSYPGFLITGDNVRQKLGTWGQGYEGRAIFEIARSPGKDVKGCGGIMAAVNA